MSTLSFAVALFFVVAAIVLTIWLLHNNEDHVRQYHYKERVMEQINPTRLQAYERFALYLERIEIKNIVDREQRNCKTSAELYAVIVNTVKQEFQHNIAMQIYVTNEVWSRILRAKEEVLKCVNEVAKEVNPQAPAVELGRELIDAAGDKCTFYVLRALDGLRADVQGLFVNE